MKLEHASAYLPHGIKVYDIGTNKLFSTPLNLNTIEYLIENITSDSILKLALRPLSDLKRHECCTDLSNNLRFNIDILGFPNYLDLKVIDYNILLENHFDIFGLIESGQAIDINTLNK